MINEKKWWQSKAVWGGLVAVGAGIAGVFGFDVDTQSQEAITQNALALAGGIGGMIAVYGRIKADSKVTK